MAFSTILGSETLEPIDVKFDVVDYIQYPAQHAKISGRQKRGWVVCGRHG